jgi:hypothetical protein
MKYLILSLFCLGSLSALADCNREAQFIGKVRNLRMTERTFTFQVAITRWFVASSICPMDESELESAVIELQGIPSIKNGQEISGVMAFDQGTQSYRIN